MARIYTTNQLMQLGQILGHVNRPQLSFNIYQRIKNLHLLKDGAYITHRGFRGGSRIQRKIKSVQQTGVKSPFTNGASNDFMDMFPNLVKAIFS